MLKKLPDSCGLFRRELQRLPLGQNRLGTFPLLLGLCLESEGRKKQDAQRDLDHQAREEFRKHERS